MIRLITLISFIFMLYSFDSGTKMVWISLEAGTTPQDTVPFSEREALVQELLRNPELKTWRDSGYYFQLEPVFWRVKKVGTTSGGDLAMQVSFSSGDPSSLRFRGRAVFLLDPALLPAGMMPASGIRGDALIAFPQDVLFCPSPAQEVGLGQNDPYFPLYLSGNITGIRTDQDYILEIPVSVQLRDLEIIL